MTVYPKMKILCAGTTQEGIGDMVTSLCGEEVEVLTAHDGHEALRYLKENPDDIKLAIMNTLLPVIDGVNLCRSLRRSAKWHSLPVALVGKSERDRAASLSAGCNEYLTTPCSKAKISEIVDKSLSLVQTRALQRASEENLSVLVVDDTSEVRTVIGRFLKESNISVREADSGKSMDKLLERMLPDIIILDIMMPGEDGLSVLRRLKEGEQTKDIPVIIVSGLGEVEIVSQALEDGAVDYLTKPIRSQRLLARVRNCRDLIRLRRLEQKQKEDLEVNISLLERRVQKQMENISASHRGTIFALSKLAESRDPETGEHLERLQGYCLALCESLRKQGKYLEILSDEFIANLAAASPLHDIGKVGIPDSVLLKPGKLTREEFDTMKTHAHIGAETLRAASVHCGNNPLIEMGIEIAEFHHEKWDGSGYPNGLSGRSIPLSGRILALGDVYDALTSKRVYKDAFSHEKSREIIVEGRGSHFDPDVVDAFLAVEEKFRHIRLSFADSVPETQLAS